MKEADDRRKRRLFIVDPPTPEEAHLDLSDDGGRRDAQESIRCAAEAQASDRWFEGRFLDGQLRMLLSELAEPGPGYAVNTITGRIWRNGEYVGDALALSYDRNALGWWVEYRSWRGSPLDSAHLGLADAGVHLDD